jgi:transcriptional regulator with XRE-family HTH domain
MGSSSRPKPARLAEKLLQVRTTLGLSQNEMLRHLGLADELFRSSISKYELGTREPPLPVLLRYAQTAGVCVDVLIDDLADLPEKIPNAPHHKKYERASLKPTKRMSKVRLN